MYISYLWTPVQVSLLSSLEALSSSLDELFSDEKLSSSLLSLSTELLSSLEALSATIDELFCEEALSASLLSSSLDCEWLLELSFCEELSVPDTELASLSFLLEALCDCAWLEPL